MLGSGRSPRGEQLTPIFFLGKSHGEMSLAGYGPWVHKESGVTERLTLSFRDITLPATIRLVKAMVFPVVTYGCESWTIKKPEHGRIHTFEL